MLLKKDSNKKLIIHCENDSTLLSPLWLKWKADQREQKLQY